MGGMTTAEEVTPQDEIGEFTPGPWEYVASTEHHGPYVSGPWGGDICDCYVMSRPSEYSTRNGGDSRPIPHQADRADANAKLIAMAPDLLSALEQISRRKKADCGGLDDYELGEQAAWNSAAEIADAVLIGVSRAAPSSSPDDGEVK